MMYMSYCRGAGVVVQRNMITCAAEHGSYVSKAVAGCHSVVWSRGVVWIRKVIVEKCG